MWFFRRLRRKPAIMDNTDCCEPGKPDPDLEKLRRKEREIAERLRILDVEREVIRDVPNRHPD